ncbi:MAG: hypothetical protein K1Y01_11020 [Vicinamibacteria bacterium]|nr:hypothetical protein [Vicinamibacteria bacterium]
MSFLLLLLVCASGALLARRLDETSPRLTDALALGAAMGLALFAGFGFVLGWAFGLSTATVLGAAALTTLLAAAVGARPSALLASGKGRPAPGVLVLVLLTAVLVGRLADRALFTTAAGVATGDRHNYGDLPFHMGIAAGFAYGANFPPDHPELAGVPLTYPFMGDLVSGMILASGGTWKDAFFWPGLILGLSVVAALTRFGEAVTGSRAIGRTAAALTFFSGGLGFLGLGDSAAFTRFWTAGPDLTIDDTAFRYANFVTTLFIPQRSILFGWPLLFFALAFLVESLRSEREAGARASLWLRAGIVGSLLPLVHSHSFAVLAFCAVLLAARANIASALAFTRGVLPLALPAILFMTARNSLSTASFFAWQPGFDGGSAHPLRFWLENAGLFLPLAIAGMACARGSSVRASLAAPFASLFILANLFRLSPWIWDNMKFLAPAHAGLAPFAAIALARAWRHGRAGKAAAVAAFVVATLSGALDVAKVAAAGGEYGIFENADFVFAEKVRAATAPSTVILTASAHDHSVLLSGRREFLGYEGHLWSQGLDYAARKPVAEAVLRGATQAAGGGVARIDAIAITPAESSVIGDGAALQALPSIVDSPYRLVRVR